VVRDYDFNSTQTCPATSQNFVRIFYNDSEAIISRISAHCPGGQTFLSEKHLKAFANHIHLVKIIQNMKLTLAKNLLRKESKPPISLKHFFNLQLHNKLRLIVTGSCNSSRHQRFMREEFFQN